MLGTPTPAELYAMNPKYDASSGFGAHVEALQWEAVLGNATPGDVRHLVASLLQYNPARRPKPLEVIASTFFDDLRVQASRRQGLNHLLLSPQEVAGCSLQAQQKLMR